MARRLFVSALGAVRSAVPNAEDRERDARTLHLPVRPFLYTLDQLCTMLSFSSVDQLRKSGYVFFMGRSQGTPRPDELRAINIATGISGRPDWRVEERDLVRWMKRKGFRYVTR